jgi:hypothetical protein
MTLALPFLLLSLAAQTSSPDIQGSVVNSKGEPVAGASMFLYLMYLGSPETGLVKTTADGQGQFRLVWPRLGDSGRGRTVNGNRSHLFAYRQGSALTIGRLSDRTHRLVLRDAAARTLTVQRADGKPLAGVRLMPRLVRDLNGEIAEIPESLAAQLAATTGTDGTATLTSLAHLNELMAVRVASDSLAEQDIVLVDRPGQARGTGDLAVSIQATSQISGRVVDEHGQGIHRQVVGVWTRGRYLLDPSSIEFAGGPVRTGPDGSFQTPPTLVAGSTFRVVVKAPGKNLIASDWITLGQKPRKLPEIVLGELRAIRGRVVDRAGKPVAGAEVLQRGDGPERTSTETDANGRFSLAGFRSRPALLFARHQEFRFHGQLVRPVQGDVTVILTRRDEPPDRVMRPLPYPEMPADSQAIARRLIEPVLDAALQRNDTQAVTHVLTTLADVDPAATLEELNTAKLLDENSRMRVRLAVIMKLARTDPEEAAGLAEAIPSAGLSAHSLLLIAKALPARRRQLKLELLDRALLKARAASGVGERLRYTAAVANESCELGEVEKAKKLIAETLPVANQYAQKTDIQRGFFAAALARIDLPAALALVDDLGNRRDKERVYGLMAIQLASTNPAEAERLWNEVTGTVYRERLEGYWRLALSDLIRARRMAARAAAQRGEVNYYIVVALGLSPRDKTAARDALQQGLDHVDPLMEDPLDDSSARSFLQIALEVVDQIDPALAADVFWRYLATRPSSFDPRIPWEPSSLVIGHVAMYDRNLARTLFEPIRAKMVRAEDSEPGAVQLNFEDWTLLDPSEAIAVALKLPINPDRLDQFSSARLQVAAALTNRDRRRYTRSGGILDFLPQP